MNEKGREIMGDRCVKIPSLRGNGQWEVSCIPSHKDIVRVTRLVDRLNKMQRVREAASREQQAREFANWTYKGFVGILRFAACLSTFNFNCRKK